MKFMLIILNIILGFFALMLVIVGLLYKKRTSFLSDLEYEVDTGLLILSAGCFLFAVAWFGSVIAISHFKWLYIIYGIFVLITYFIQTSAGVISCLEALRIKAYIKKPLIDKFKIYYSENVTNETVIQIVDEIQKKWKCCGMLNITDYSDTLPSSCCPKIEETRNCTKNLASKSDCSSAAQQKIYKPLRVLGIAAILLAILEFFLALWSFYSARNISE